MGQVEPRVLLLQVRDEPRAEEQERLCFLEAAGLHPDRLTCHNLVSEPRIDWPRARAFDVVMVGGAGAHTVTGSYPFSEPLNEVLRRLVEGGRPLFAGLPSRFPVQLGHHDRVEWLPEALVELAASDRCRFQALRAPGLPIYSTQFHSEMTVEHMTARLIWYRDGYLAERTTEEEVSRILSPSDEAAILIRRFFELYL